jgi:hypothetical protein
MFSNTWRVCASMPPSTILPLLSVAIWPETNTRSPARIARENGSLAPPLPVN